MKQINKKIIIILFILSMPFFMNAQVVITEVMYDSVGSDTNKEWIELRNIGGASVDVTEWRLFEGGTNHEIKLYKGNKAMNSKEYSILVNKPEQFLKDYPAFSGTILDSSFNLSNSGETLVLKDKGLAEKDSFSYSSNVGANGDGNTLNVFGNRIEVGLPTPGEDFLPYIAKNRVIEGSTLTPRISAGTKGDTILQKGKEKSSTSNKEVLSQGVEKPVVTTFVVQKHKGFWLIVIDFIKNLF